MNKETNPILLIPLCGVGKRFQDSGYKIHKSLLDVHKKCMLERVINKFPQSFDTYIISTARIKEKITKSKDIFFNIKNIKWIIIEEHKLGPGYTLKQSVDNIPSDRPIYISYCDITWEWHESDLPHQKTNIEAAIFTHHGFHPHLINNSFSAFCKKDKNNYLIKIKEKGSFTKDWMNEELSIGLFYIRKKSLLKESLFELINKKYIVNNEYYPSLIFNFFIKKNIKVNLIKVKSFVHYGTPDQLEDFKDWLEKSNNLSINKKIKFSTIVLAAGRGKRMKNISNSPKGLIKIGNQRLINKVIYNLPINNNKLFLIVENKFSELYRTLKISTQYEIKKTSNQLDSLKESIKFLIEEKSILICSCDCYGKFDCELLLELIKSEKYEFICFGFKPTLTQTKLGGHTYFSYKSDKVQDIFIKERKDSNNKGLAGFFWAKDSRFLNQQINNLYESKVFENINRELIIDDLVNFLVMKGKRVGFIPLENYIHLGSELEYKEYSYWQKNIKGILNLNME